VSVIDAPVQRALPVLWRGERRFIDVPASMINIDRLTATLCREPGPAAIVVRSATGDGVSILAGNSRLTSYATNGSFDDAVAAPDARLEVRASPPVSSPEALTAPPAAENPQPSGEVDLQPAVDEMCRLVHERLHQHGGALEQAIRSSSRTRDELRKLAQHVRDMSIRGITPATMSEISRELAQVVERV
jgi:hypothetical protein